MLESAGWRLRATRAKHLGAPMLPIFLALLLSAIRVTRWSLIQEVVEFHLEGMREEGISIPSPASFAGVVEINSAA
jgi:hypothetical protein